MPPRLFAPTTVGESANSCCDDQTIIAKQARVMAKTYQALLWSQMAAEARAVADRLHNDGLQLSVLAVAERYVALAKRAETLARRGDEEPGVNPRSKLHLGFATIGLHPGLDQNGPNGVQRGAQSRKNINLIRRAT
jgi:hypothetical protein